MSPSSQPGTMLVGIKVGDFATNAELLALECDVLIPAAMESSMNMEWTSNLTEFRWSEQH